ncbi:MAG TPA: TolC family protein [Polyangiaceae bacterium]|nr:TolC family protein [Polyangiaceae bacterium]
MTRARTWSLVLAALCFALAWSAQAEPRRLSLERAVSLARQNPLARAALERARAASAQVDEAKGARFPRATLTSFIGPSPEIHCVAGTNCSQTEPHEVRLRFEGVYGGVTAELLQPLYTFGKVQSAINAAGGNLEMNQVLATGAADDMGLEAARAYLGIDLARELGEMLDDGREKLDAATKTLAERLERGESDVTVQDRLRLETFMAEILARQSEARESEATARFGLQALVGDPDADTLGEPLEPLGLNLEQAKTYVDRAAQGRTEVRAAVSGVTALEALRNMERARLLPDLGIIAGGSWTRAGGVDDPPSAFANDPFNHTTAYAALVLRWTIEPAAQIARLARANAELERGRDLLQAARRAGDFAVLQAYTRATEAHHRLDAATAGEKSARGWVASVMQADAIGTVTAREMADAYLAYFTIHSRLLQSTYEFDLALLTLRRAIGESLILPPKPH